MLVCGQPEGESHVHTGDCYEPVLTCELEEHSHSDACYSNPSADTETDADWEATFADVKLTGVWADDLLTIAESQLGYAESSANYVVTEDGSHMGYTRYGAWYGDAYGHWCAMFVSFCLNYANVPAEVFPREASCARWISKLSQTGQYKSADSYVPAPGDLVFFDRDGDGNSDHVGLVMEASDQAIRTIEGNSGDRVQSVTYELTDPRILGYGCLPENPDAPKPESDLLAEDTLSESDARGPIRAPIPDTVVDGGTIEGTQLTWSLTKSASGEYTLTVSGTGAIPDYTQRTAPWYNYTGRDRQNLKINLVLEEGVTRVGNYAFYYSNIDEITLPATVTELGTCAFSSCLLTEVDLSGTSITRIENSCFASMPSLRSVTLPQGLTYLHRNSFISSAVQTLELPAGLTKIDGGALMDIEESITVADGNTRLKVVNGVLFRLNDDGTAWSLVSCPRNLPLGHYTVPEAIDNKPVTEIGTYAFYNAKQLTEITIPGSVKTIGSNAFQNSSLQRATVESTTLTNSNGAFVYSTNLQEITFNNLTGAIPVSFLGNATALPSLTIPAGITTIGNNAFQFCNSLSTVVYDAEKATWNTTYPPMGSATLPRYDLTIGANVDVLGANFYQMAERANTLTFVGPNQITIAEGALAGAPAPYSGFSGEIYVDENGLIYALDVEEQEAALVYCPPGMTVANVPQTLTLEADKSYAVTSVKRDALKYARDLQSISFEGVTHLESYALANCPTLKSVNGETTVDAATATFEEGSVGYGAFYNTGLEGAVSSDSFAQDMDGEKDLEITEEGATKLTVAVSSKGGTMEWVPQEGDDTEESGGYRLLTGDTLNVNISLGNTEGETVLKYYYRVYLRLTDSAGSLSVTPGESYTFGEGGDMQQVTCYATEDPNTVYLEFMPQTGKTMSFPVTAVYPSPDSAGGGLEVWGHILLPSTATGYYGKLLEPEEEDGVLQAYWTTQPDTFAVTKTSTSGVAENSSIGIVGDGEGVARPNGELRWEVVLNRASEEASAYGKDYAESVEFTDAVTLPTGVSWDEAVKQAIQTGNVRWSGNYLYAGNTAVAQLNLSSGSGLYLLDRRVTWDDEKDTALFHWRVANNISEAEMNASKVQFYVRPAALSVDMDQFDTTQAQPVSNAVDATVHYHYGGTAALDDSATSYLKGGAGTIELKKTASSVQFFGEDITYTLDVYNNGGLSWTGVPYTDQEGNIISTVYTVYDPLSQYVYISPENLEEMFGEEYGGSLTVTIRNASLGTWQSVTGADGDTGSWQTPENSDLGAAADSTLTITKTDSGYAVAVEGGNTYTADTVSEALRQAGYGVTPQATYTCTWALNQNGEDCTLLGGEHWLFPIYATVKDTFQMMTTDWPNEYPADSLLQITNRARVLKPDNKTVQVWSGTTNNTVKREARIDKSVYKDGQLLLDSPTAEDGDVLEYHLDFTHYGSGAYEDLPMVDDLYGSQYLMVPQDQNPGLENLGLENKDGFYLLKEGTYTNVVVGVDDEGNRLTADSITVTGAQTESDVLVNGLTYSYTGLHTQIKWYFPELEGDNYRKTVTYQALVDKSLADSSYTIGNVVWMNDRTGSRIYDALWGGGTIIEFGKDIVTAKGATYSEDVLDEDGYSLVEEGEQVTYRLTLHNTGDGSFTLNGKDLADALPQSAKEFVWEKGVNITDFQVQTAGNVICTDLSKWEVGSRYPGVVGDDLQFILWPDASITFNGPSTVYIYFTLTFPRDTGESAAWSQYADALHGSTINNTLYVHRFPSVVTHDLKEPGEVLLQKGVYGMYRYENVNANKYTAIGDSRTDYNNRDSKFRAVLYYVTLYNGGNKRLYLNDLYDELPAGFTYRTMVRNGTELVNNLPTSQISNIVTTCGTIRGNGMLGTTDNNGAIPLAVMEDSSVSYRSARVVATKTSDGVRFSLGAGTGDYALRYDAEREQYYLDTGEAVVFGYMCDIGLSENTENSASNAIAMPYTDQPETGAVPIDKDSLRVSAPASEQFGNYNDGTRLTKTADQVKTDYGFESEGKEKLWLVSEVTVRRGGIVPGVTKYTESSTNSGGSITPYTDSVGPNDTVNWRVRLHNSGTLSLMNYTFEDAMPAPYVFVGDVKGVTYDGNGNALYSETLLTFPSERTGTEETLQITYQGKQYTVSFDGEETKLTDTFFVSFRRVEDEAGEKMNEVLRIRLTSPNAAIPEGGYMDVTLSSKNPTTTYVNTVYTNQATLIPNVQEFTTVQQGSMVRDEMGKPVSVTNTSPVTVSFGFDTSSEKCVTEIGHDGVLVDSNSAVSTDQQNNTILLANAAHMFRYTLKVNNTTDNAMTKLVLIDGLPEEGDHSPFHRSALRGSEFKVSLAEEPNFSITITEKDGTEAYVLDPGYYEVQYTKDDHFGGPDSADWKGENNELTTAEWSENTDAATIANARAFRIIIKDPEGTQLPAGCTISVAFNARVDGDAAPGGVAWNNFGYRYGLKGVDTELEAMPLVVGVRLPSIPALEKKLVDVGGEPVAAAEDTAFSFLVYQGAALEGSYDTAEALEAALEAGGRSFKQFDVTVKAGENTSGEVFLNAQGWDWKDGEQYTIVELPSDSGLYSFRSFIGSNSAAYTFTYRNMQKVTIQCENTFQQWKLSLTKEDIKARPLSGAVFALYSPKAEDLQSVPEQYGDLGIEATVMQDGQTWYLVQVDASGDGGKLEWENLLREKYYLLEIKAPDGYYISDPAGQFLYRSASTGGVYNLSVVNHAGYVLPESGGAGTTMTYIGGLLTTALAGLLLYKKRNTKRRI